MPMPDPVIRALDEQLQCYQRLAKLAQLQHEYVQRSQNEALLEILGKRQLVLDQVTRLEQIIAPAKKQWGDYLAKLDDASRSRAESLLAQVRQLLEQITAADRDDALVLQQRKLNVGRQIDQASTARQVNRTYAAAAYGKPAPRMDVKQ